MKSYDVQTDYKVKNKQKQVKVEFSKETRLTIIRLLIAFILLLLGSSSLFSRPISIGLFVLAYLTIGSKIVYKALKNIFHGEIFDENFLMSIATIGAIILGEYPEAIAVMLFYELGNVFEDVAVNRSKKSISALLEVKPDFATLKLGNKVQIVDPAKFKLGKLLWLNQARRFP